MISSIKDPKVAAVFEQYPSEVADRLLGLRNLILSTAARLDEVGPIEETLRWGQPSYLTSVSKSGSTIRIHTVKDRPGEYAIFFNCNTTLVETFRQMYPDLFEFEGNRAIVFASDDELPEDALSDCIARALCYHIDKRSR